VSTHLNSFLFLYHPCGLSYTGEHSKENSTIKTTAVKTPPETTAHQKFFEKLFAKIG
jgi:hypothetical protein